MLIDLITAASILIIGSGFALTATRRVSSAPARIILFPALAFGFGAGISSLLYYCHLLAGGGSPALLAAAEAAFSCAGIVLYFTSRKLIAAPGQQSPPERAGGGALKWALGAALLFTSARSAALYFSWAAGYPYGSYDALNVWTFRGAFFAASGGAWARAFEPVYITNSFNYPLLVSNLCARGWEYAGAAGPSGPALLAALFAFGALALLVGGVKHFTGGKTAAAAGLVLTGTPFFFLTASLQAADVPLSFFILLSFLLYLLHVEAGRDFPSGLATGLALGCCAWTKNEGAMFAAIFLAAQFSLSAFSSGLRVAVKQFAYIAIGLSPAAAAVAHLGSSLGLGNPAASGASLAGAFSAGRLAVVFNEFIAQALNVKQFNWFLGALAAAAPPVLAAGLLKKEKRAAAIGLLAAVLLFLSCVAADLVYPRAGFGELVRNTLSRFIIQIYPSLIFLAALIVSPEREKQRG